LILELRLLAYREELLVLIVVEIQDVSVEYPRILSGAKYIFVRKSVFFGYELKLLISTAGGRFPRAWLEPPRSLRSLWGLKAHAIHTGVAAFRSNQRCSASDYE